MNNIYNCTNNEKPNPADILILGWSGGKDAALDTTVIHSLQNATRAEEAITPGQALTFAYDRKVRGAGKVELSSWWWQNPFSTTVEQVKKLASGVSMRTGQKEGECSNNLLSRISLTLMKGLSALILNRTTFHL